MENKRINVTVSLFFEIAGSEMFGGAKSVGYTASKIDMITCDLKNFELQEYVKSQTEALAELMMVPKENIRVISREEYEENIEED